MVLGQWNLFSFFIGLLVWLIKGNFLGVIYLDFYEVFDFVLHDILIKNNTI